MDKLSGKTALVTGSTNGVGRLLARKLGQAGARVLMYGRHAERGSVGNEHGCLLHCDRGPLASWRRMLAGGGALGYPL